jgi:hypothetical protein
MNPDIAAVLSGPRKLTLLRDGNTAFVEVEPLRFFPVTTVDRRRPLRVARKPR